MDSTLKRRGNERFHVVSTWNPRGMFVGLLLRIEVMIIYISIEEDIVTETSLDKIFGNYRQVLSFSLNSKVIISNELSSIQSCGMTM